MRIILRKYCPDCKTRKPESEFYKFSRGYLSKRCIECTSVFKRQSRMNNLELSKKDERQQRIYKNHGIPWFLYDRKLAEQDYKCAICETEITGQSAHLDHNHATGKHREFLCAGCNHGLGKFKDNPDLLRKAALYLEKFN